MGKAPAQMGFPPDPWSILDDALDLVNKRSYPLSASRYKSLQRKIRKLEKLMAAQDG